MNSAIFTTAINALGETFLDTWKKFGILDPETFIKDFFINGNEQWLNNQRKSFGETFVKEFFQQWHDILINNHRAKMCVVSATRNYKSPLAIALIGI